MSSDADILAKGRDIRRASRVSHRWTVHPPDWVEVKSRSDALALMQIEDVPPQMPTATEKRTK
jgi:hypothetical protein